MKKQFETVNFYYLCPICYKEDRQQIVNPDEEFCPSYGCKIDWDLAVKVEETALDEDVLLEQTFQPIGDEWQSAEDPSTQGNYCYLTDFTNDELMEMPEGEDASFEYLEAIQKKGRTSYNLIKNYYKK